MSSQLVYNCADLKKEKEKNKGKKGIEKFKCIKQDTIKRQKGAIQIIRDTLGGYV